MLSRLDSRGRATRGAAVLIWIGTFVAGGMLCNAPVVAQQVIYVNAGASGSADGTDWSNAFTDLQDALDAATGLNGGACEIWVAAGVYKPDRGTGDRVAAFELRNNVAIYGGFAGTESKRDRRDPTIHETILSGDLYGDDDPTAQPLSDCCSSDPLLGCSDQACLDEVVEYMRPRPGSRQDCATYWRFPCPPVARILCCDLCRPTFCDNSYNVVRADNTDRTAILDGVTITAGEADHNPDPADPNGGRDFGRGGGLLTTLASPTVSRCIFRANRGQDGFAMYSDGGQPRITGCSFVENRTIAAAPAVNLRRAEPTIENCKFVRNDGGALWVSGRTQVVGCAFVENTLGALYLSGAPIVNRCSFVKNSNTACGGAIASTGSAGIYDSVFIGNSSPCGGAVSGFFDLIIVNCLFSGNRGGAVETNSIALINSTLAGNSDVGIAGVSALLGGIYQSIFWNNYSDAYGDSERAQLGPLSYADLTIRHSTVMGWTGTYGGQEISNANPLFRDENGPDGAAGTVDDDLRLSADSPAINTGDPNPTLLPSHDLDGQPRVLCGRVDVGAYESGIGDFDCNRVVDVRDLMGWNVCVSGPNASAPQECKSFDADNDSDVDLMDMARFQQVVEQ